MLEIVVLEPVLEPVLKVALDDVPARRLASAGLVIARPLAILDSVRLAPTPRAPRLSRSGLILSLYLALLVLAVGWGAARGRANIFVVDGGPHRTAEGLVLSVAVALVAAFLTRWSVHRLAWARRLRLEFRELLGPLTAMEILILAGASSVGEEALFRGAMVPHLGLWLSSAIFALPHIGPGARFLPWTASSFVVGVIFGELLLFGGNLGAPIAAHFLINFLNLRYITDRPR